MISRLGLAVASLLCCAPLARAQVPVPEQPVPFRTGVEVVAVDVAVLDRTGRPLRGLSANDFVVSVEGEPRRVVSADFVDWGGAADAPARADAAPVSSNEGAAGGRVFAFVVDLNTLEPGSSRRVTAAASGLFARLTSRDRSALMVLPVGPGVELTWAHDRVFEALQRVGGMAHVDGAWEYGSLSEAKDIANRGGFALRRIAERECGTATFASGGGGLPAPPSGGTQGAGTGGGGGATAGSGAGGGGVSAPGTGGGSAALGGGGVPFENQCVRRIQMEAESAWRSAEAISLTALTSLRQIIAGLGHIAGDKTLIIVSGGWPLEEREQMSLLSIVSAEAAAARVTLFPFFVPPSTMSASRRTMSASPGADEQVLAWSLETLAGMTGGTSFRVPAGAEGAFDRLGRELAGYYRIGVERTPGDVEGKRRPLKVQVPRASGTVRARAIFDVPTFEDRNWAARLNAALSAPSPATGVGLRVTSYVAADLEDSSRVRLLLAGEASRLEPGETTFQVALRDDAGDQTVSEEQLLGTAGSEGLPFSVNVPVAPRGYTVRLAVMDKAGHVGSVEHRVDARRARIGQLTGYGPLLVRIRGEGGDPVLVVDGVRSDERLALQLDLVGEAEALAGSEVEFEIASTTDGPALLRAAAALTPNAGGRAVRAEALTDVRLLPPGQYVARARVHAGGDTIGSVGRPFAIEGTHRTSAEPAGTVTAVVPSAAPAHLAARAAAMTPPFSVDRVLTPAVLGPFLDQVAERADASAPAVQDLLQRARTSDAASVAVPDAVVSQAPAATAFLRGLSLLSARKLDAAANEFRNAMRLAPDFYPAMVYLGACYAAGGRHAQAAGAWRTALIKEADAVALHTLLADALLRDGKSELAAEALERARTRWPDDADVTRRFATASIAAGRYAEGLDAVDELVAAGADDEAVLGLALLTLYEAFAGGEPVVGLEQDRVRMTRLAAAYRARGGASLALVEKWLAAAADK